MSRERSPSISSRDPVVEEAPVPILRGVSHAVAFWFALAAAFLLVIVAPGPARAPALVYGIGLCALFAISGLYHRWRWDHRWRPLLRRLDHMSAATIVLLGLGALLYCIGACVYAFERPDPWPSTFGFHEVFHSLVILAAASHFAAMAGWIIPNAA